MRITPRLLAAPCPTLLVAGERELKHVRASNRLLSERMPHAEARMVPGTSHGWGPSRFPDIHLRMVAAWIAGRQLPAELVAETTPRHWARSFCCLAAPAWRVTTCRLHHEQ